MTRTLTLTDEQRDQIARESLDHGQMLDSAFAAGVEAATVAIIADLRTRAFYALQLDVSARSAAFVRGLDAAVLIARGERPVSLVIDISVSRVDYLLTVQARRTEDRSPGRDVYTYQVSISGPLSARLGETRLGLRAKRIGFVEHAYSHGALDLTRKALDLAQAWIDKEGLGT